MPCRQIPMKSYFSTAHLIFSLSILLLSIGANAEEQPDLTNSETFVIHSERTVIRILRSQDIPRLLEFMTDPNYASMNGIAENISQQRLEYSIQQTQKSIASQSKESVSFTLLQNEIPIGALGFGREHEITSYAMNLELIREGERAVAISYSLHPNYRHQGLATEAIVRMLQYLFDNLGYEAVSAIILEENAPSRRLIETLGFVNYVTWTGLYGGVKTPQSFHNYYLSRTRWRISCEKALMMKPLGFVR